MITKAMVIQHIQQINSSVSHEWLDRFDISALTRYLDHLQHAMEPRDRASVWVRNGETPAVVTGRPAEGRYSSF